MSIKSDKHIIPRCKVCQCTIDVGSKSGMCRPCLNEFKRNNQPKNYCIDCNKQITLYHKRCRSCAAKFYSSGKNNGMYGKKHTSEAKQKISLSKLGKPSPKKLPSVRCIDCGKQIWRGNIRCKKCNAKSSDFRKKLSLGCGGTGIPYELSEYGEEFDSGLKEQIRFRDDYTCQNCGTTQLKNGKCLDVHHIDYNKKNCAVNNLISLCKSCHMKTTVKNRKYWIEYYTQVVKRKTKR